MIIEFSVANYLSLKDKATLPLISVKQNKTNEYISKVLGGLNLLKI